MSLQGTYTVPQIMIDLEALAQKPNSALVSIGACSFGQGKIYSEFYIVIDAKSCVEKGLVVDPETIEWWKKQSPEARAVLRAPSVSIEKALEALVEWMPGAGSKGLRIWTNGISYDIPILTSAFEACGMKLPGHWANYLDARTIFKLCPEVTWERTEVAHNAMEDAKAQAIHLMKCLDL